MGALKLVGDSFRLTIRNVNSFKGLNKAQEISCFRLTIRNVN